MEWTIAIIVFLAVVAGVFYFLGDVRATGGHSGQSATDAQSRVVAVVAT